MENILKYKKAGIILISLLVICIFVASIYSITREKELNLSSNTTNGSDKTAKPKGNNSTSNNGSNSGSKPTNGQKSPSATPKGAKPSQGNSSGSNNEVKQPNMTGVNDTTLTSKLKKEKGVIDGRIYVDKKVAYGAIIVKNGTSKSAATALANKYSQEIKKKFKDMRINVQVVDQKRSLAVVTI